MAERKTSSDGGSGEDEKFDTVWGLIRIAPTLPLVRVDREDFLRHQFKGSPYLEQIIELGPQSVYSVDSLAKKARKVVELNSSLPALASFILGLPSNPVTMLPAVGIGSAKNFVFVLRMAQQIAYLFGEYDLFVNGQTDMPEEAQMRIIAYLGAMFGVSGAAGLIAKVQGAVGVNLGKKLVAQPLMKTTWSPLLKKTAALIGQKMTKQTLAKGVTKAVPVLGGAVSGGLTFATFRPMGYRLIDAFVDIANDKVKIDMKANPGFEERPKGEGQTIFGTVVDYSRCSTRAVLQPVDVYSLATARGCCLPVRHPCAWFGTTRSASAEPKQR